MFTLITISVLAIIGASLAAFGNASLRATRAYDGVRDTRYAADGAIKEAVNWIAKNDEVAVDPDYLPSANDDCVYRSESVQGEVLADDEVLTVSCETEPGSGAGIPPDPGIAPPESILLLGDRHNEPGPYSYEKCESLWDSITGWINNDTPGQSEKGFTAKQRQRSTWGGFGSCETRERGLGPISVEGNIHVAGRLQLADGFKLAVAGGDGGVVKVRYGCEDSGGPFDSVVDPAGAPTTPQCNHDEIPRVDPGMPWDGRPIYADPGRIADTATPIGDIQPEFLPVGFDADGSVADGYTLPERTTAYRYDKDANTSGSATVPKHLVELPPSGPGSCNIPAGTPVIFLWGRYTDARTLNAYTANPSCPDRTFWFAPNPGADRELLTADDQTAAFYLDFTNTAGASRCGGMESSNPFRWCLGGASQNSSSKPRVVVGWPDDWTALPTADPSGTGSGDAGYGQRVGVEIDTAGAVEGNFLTFWRNQGDAKVVDGNPATYEPCTFWIFTCPSFGERSMRLAQFTPKVGGSPIAEDGLPNGRLFLDVHFAMANADGTVPKVVVDYLDPRENVARSCGEFTLDLSGIDTDHAPGTAVPASSKATLSDSDAAVLAENCGSVQAINNLRVTFKVEKNVWNSGFPTFDLDGVRMYYDSYQGASFPLPNECTDSDGDGDIDEFDTCGVPLSGVDNPVDPAKSDCDPSRPGGQLIFGGATHVYAADGSLEVCGGPHPGDPQHNMVIGIYGVPGVEELRATSAPVKDNDSSGGNTTFDDPDHAMRIGEPLALEASGITYAAQCTGFLGIQTCKPKDGGAKEIVYSFPGFTPPAGYRVSKVSARASYETEGGRFTIETGGDSSRLKVGSCNEAARQTRGELRQWANEPAGSSSPLVLYDGDTRNCITPPTGGIWANGLAPTEVRWKPNVPSNFNFIFGGGCFVVIGWCNYDQNDLLDGIELDVEIRPIGTMSSESDTSTPVLTPQSGCITAHPNYDGGQGPNYVTDGAGNLDHVELQNPDCALVRADSYTADGSDATDGGLCWGTCPGRRTNWFGRVSVKGTIYAPSAAVEIDDNDIGYPLATRGVILRHLRISGANPRANFTGNLFGNQLDKEPNPRVAQLTACIQQNVDPNAPRPCDPDVDRVVARSGVRFAADPTDPDPTAADVPEVEWYTDATTESS